MRHIRGARTWDNDVGTVCKDEEVKEERCTEK